MHRAVESEREDALFNDPYADSLAGERGRDIVGNLPVVLRGSWATIVRTKLIDDMVGYGIDQGIRTVLNLAAGLDTRPYRLDLPSNLRWIHADMPDLVSYFTSRMDQVSPRCATEFVPIDLRDDSARQDLLARVSGEGPMMVISEGLLIYLTSEQATNLARDLHDVAAATYWVADVTTPYHREMLQRHKVLEYMQRSHADMQFFPEDGAACFASLGWREMQFHSLWEAAFRLGRAPPVNRVARWLLKLKPASQREAIRRMAGVSLMQAS